MNNSKEAHAVISKYQPQLTSFIRRRVRSNEDAEDILQDVWYQFLKTLETSLNPIEHVSAWLYKVARNVIINKGTKKREEEMPVYAGEDTEGDTWGDFAEILFAAETSPSPETEYLRSLFWEELETALAELPAEQRHIFELTELEGRAVKDVAETTGVSVNTLLSRKHYAVKHLRKRLERLYEEILFD
ncbi:MAG: sigma-70 family RNA polymerase sigma factor [Bacteroidales bacterium]|jgi:RNA polymerase sigma factor (sigma-70 family)|nr:sigma-70 family RNA polymerase sigma factor [Bacteroidales bacterium]